jgi:uncharacterized membrane protein
MGRNPYRIFGRLVRYHLGTVAFGSFIIALVQLIRLIMHYVESRVKVCPVLILLGPYKVQIRNSSAAFTRPKLKDRQHF